MAVLGADVDELRSTAKQLTQAADQLQSSMKSLSTLISNASMWRGPDSDQFRSEWRTQSVHSLTSAVDKLRAGADALRRNADQQENASRAEGGTIGGPGGSQNGDFVATPTGLHGLWGAIHDIPKDSSGYRVQKVIGADGVERYIVYIAGTDGADGQTKLSNIPAAQGRVDEKQVEALKRLIPKDAEVMLVGFSQGGMDAQNIAKLHEFNVTQIVTYGSPTRADLDIPAVHLRASGDQIPNSTTAVAGAGLIYRPASAVASGIAGAIDGALQGGPLDAINGAVNGAALGANPLAAPYAGSTLGLGANNEVFHGDANVDGDMWNHHNNGYENVSKQYDQAVANGTAGDMNKHVGDFQGIVVDHVDIKNDGSGNW